MALKALPFGEGTHLALKAPPHEEGILGPQSLPNGEWITPGPQSPSSRIGDYTWGASVPRRSSVADGQERLQGSGLWPGSPTGGRGAQS